MSYADFAEWMRGPEWAAVLEADAAYSDALRAAFGKQAGDERYVRDDSHHPEVVRDARRRFMRAMQIAENAKPRL